MDLKYLNQYRKYFPQKLSPKLSPRKTSSCKKYSSLFPGEFDGEDAKEECSSEDPKNPNKAPRGENEGESSKSNGNNGMNQLHDAVLKIKSNRIVVSCLKKLCRLQQAEDIKRFSTRSDPAQNGCWRKSSKNEAVHSDCCFARNNNSSLPEDEDVDEKDVGFIISSPGPFQCCPMPIRHSRSHDYDFVPKLRKSQTNNNCENKLIYGPSFFSQPQFGKASAKSKPLSSSQNVISKCRGCPKNLIFFYDPDMYYQDYKYQITHGRIPKAHKTKLKGNFQAWLASDDYKDRVNWIKTKNLATQKYQANNRMKGIGDSPRKSLSSNDESRFGPSAIQRISGCYKPITIRPKKVVAQYSRLSPGMEKNASEDFEIEIPFPSDNVRYYDDDSDPRVIENLAKTPFVECGENKSSIYLTFTKSKETTPSIKPEQSPSIEYVVGLPEPSCSARKEEIENPPRPKPAKMVFLNQHHNVMGDTIARNWSNVSCTKNPRNSGIGDNVAVKEKVQENMEIMPPIISQDAKLTRSKEIKKVVPKTSISTPQLRVPDKKSPTTSTKPEPIQSTSRQAKLSVSSPSTNLKTKPPVVQSPRLQKKVLQGIIKPKAVRSRRFQKSITTVALTVPVSKNSNVMI